jgi:hypothetical protein
MPKRFLLCCLLLLVAVSASGCFLRLVLGAEVVEDLGEQIDRVVTAMLANATTAVCLQSDFFTSNRVECDYVIPGPDGFATVTSTATLVSEFGLFGVVIDPLVVELPAGATDIAGTFDDGAGTHGALVVYPGLSFVPVDDARTLAAGPGKQLVILDLPDGVPVDGVTYQYGLTFRQQVPAGTGPTSVKALLTGKIRVGGKTFYPPLVPCVSDLSAVPSIAIPRSATLEPLALPGGLTGCSGAVYTYFRLPRACDLDNDHDVDGDDLRHIQAAAGMPAAAGDPRDRDASGEVDAADVALCAAQCTGTDCDVPEEPVAVGIDVKPGSAGNPVNPRANGVIPVAILTTDAFDATSVDVASLRFGPGGAAEAHGRGHAEDVDGDGDVDLVVHFRTRQAGLACGDTSVTLTGTAGDGRAFTASDAIVTVGCR